MSHLLGSISTVLIDRAIGEELHKQKRFDIFKNLVGSLDKSLTDLAKGKISFYNPQGGLVAFANKQVLGCWDSETKVWQWAWSLPHGQISETLKQDAKMLFFAGVRNKWPLFATPKFKASRHILRALCALSQQQVGSWYCAAYKRGSKYWYVLIKNMNYLDPLTRITLDQQMSGYTSSVSRISPVAQERLALQSSSVISDRTKPKREAAKRTVKRRVAKHSTKRRAPQTVSRRAPQTVSRRVVKRRVARR